MAKKYKYDGPASKIYDLLMRDPSAAGECNLSKLDRCYWPSLIIRHPELTKYCTFEAIGAGGWAHAVSCQPALDSVCPFEKFDSWAWANLIKVRPQFAERCDMSILNGRQWGWILNKQPQLRKYFSWENIAKQPEYAGELIEAVPSLISECPKGIITGHGWANILMSKPDLAKWCEWDRLSDSDLDFLCSNLAGDWRDKKLLQMALEVFPQGRVMDRLMAYSAKREQKDAQKAADENAKYTETFPTGGKPKYSDDWARLVAASSKYDKVCDWKQFKGIDWVRILKQRPKLADKCDFSKFSGEDWFLLLLSVPKNKALVRRCDWSKLSLSQMDLLLEQSLPDARKLVPKAYWTPAYWMSEISGDHGHPELLEDQAIAKLRDIHIASILVKIPQLASRFDLSKLNRHQRKVLAEYQPEAFGEL